MLSSSLESIKSAFELRSGLANLEYDILSRTDGEVLRLKLANPTERFFKLLEDAQRQASSGDDDRPKITLVKAAKADLLAAPEGRLLLRTLAESLNVSRHTFGDEFFSRYTKSVFSAEAQITALANHIVFGRRGAGKSSLLLYALYSRAKDANPSIWIDMQTYARRSDLKVVADILIDLLTQAKAANLPTPGAEILVPKLHSLIERNDDIDATDIRALLPEVRRSIGEAAASAGGLVLFLDDFHVLAHSLQPRLLQQLYSIARGNKVFLKLSAIETLTSTWNPKKQEGLQIPHDIQEIRLDLNLTIPEKATEHISSILNAHAEFCGLPSIKSICTSPDVLSRLVWVAAGVPRDALSTFAQAMTKTSLGGGRKVSVSNVNVAASDTVSTKLRDLDSDASGEATDLKSLLEQIRAFCVTKEGRGRNAFLVELKTSNAVYQRMQKLVDLRLLHVISEGVSIGAAGRKYLGLVLDYGFYVGIRAARSVELFNKQTKRVARRDLRGLPVFDLSET